MSSTLDSTRELPSKVRYSDMFPLSVHGTAKTFKFLPQTGGDFTKTNNVIRFNLNSSTAFLDGSGTALKFTYQNLSGVDAQFDGSAHSCIERLRIISSTSNMDLEDMNHYGQVYNTLADLQMGSHQRMAKSIEGFGYKGTLSPAIGRLNALGADGAAVLVAAAQAAYPAVPAVTEVNMGCGTKLPYSSYIQ